MDDEAMSPTVQEILDNDKYKWIFVGGKGGVGKTTTSCSLAVELSKTRESVLIISTDPAHNLSDAFNQKIGNSPTKIEAIPNLFAMEIDAKIDSEGLSKALGDMAESTGLGSFMEEIGSSLPGIDEAMSFAEVLKLVVNLNYSVVVFDTAPTGHTLRFLSFPDVLEKGIGRMMALKSRFGGVFKQFGSLFGMDGQEDLMESKWEETRALTAKVNAQFKDPLLTTFVCVCIPEFLSVYETERLVQELGNYQIDTHTIVINQILYPEKDSNCQLCKSREAMQRKYLQQLEMLYHDFHLVKMPLQKEEIRGIEKLRSFGDSLRTPHIPH